MLSIYNKNIDNICNEFCNGFYDVNNNKISGVLEWIKLRIQKELKEEFLREENKANKEQIKNFKDSLDDITIKKILCSKPTDLLNLWTTDFKKFKDVKLIIKVEKNIKSVNLISHIFDYSSFRRISSKSKFSGFLLAKKLGIESCPYCNRNYTTSHITLEEKRVFPEFDHFYHKNSYPLFAVSFYNLIPSCNICNTHFKGSKDSIEEQLFHPYTELKPNAFKFSFIPQNVASLYGKNDNYDLNFIINDFENKDTIKRSLDFFGIKEIYEKCHSDLIKEIVNKKLSYSDKYLEIIKDTYGISFEESYRILFETYYEDDQLYKRPFSKLKKDIFDAVNII